MRLERVTGAHLLCEGLVEREWPWKLDNMSSNSSSKAFDKLLNLSDSQFP